MITNISNILVFIEEADEHFKEFEKNMDFHASRNKDRVEPDYMFQNIAVSQIFHLIKQYRALEDKK